MAAKRDRMTLALVLEMAAETGVDERTARLIWAYACEVAELLPAPDDELRERLRVLLSAAP